jgi:uncharacterized protein YndB with AHSA1/START domain
LWLVYGALTQPQFTGVHAPAHSMHLFKSSFSVESPLKPVLELAQPIGAAPDVIWKAFATPRGIARWQADEAEGDAKEGGLLRLHWLAFGASVDLQVLECVPHRQLRLKRGNTEVVFTLHDKCVNLAQYGLDPGDDVEGLRSSWQVALAQLAHSVERHPGRRRHVDWVLRTTAAQPETLHSFFTDPIFLNLWLGRCDETLRQGQPYELELHSGLTISGKVLSSVAGRDLALSCQNLDDAVLVWRSLPHPASDTQRVVAISVSQWGKATRSGERLTEQLDAALGRLTTLLSARGQA